MPVRVSWRSRGWGKEARRGKFVFRVTVCEGQERNSMWDTERGI